MTKQKVALITGAGKGNGMGFAAARKLAEKGYSIALADIAPLAEETKARADELVADKGVDAQAFVCDVTDPSSVGQSVSEVLKHFGKIDVLFNNAGIGGIQNLVDADIEMFDRMYNVNVRGVALMAKAVLPSMLDQKSGVIINNASVAGIYGTPGLTHYCASKHAVIGLTKALAGEVGSEGIRVVAVCPGLVKTDIYGDALEGAGLDREAAREEMDRMTESVSLNRWADPSEIGDFVAYLAGDEASYLTGAAFQIHGGFPKDNVF